MVHIQRAPPELPKRDRDVPVYGPIMSDRLPA